MSTTISYLHAYLKQISLRHKHVYVGSVMLVISAQQDMIKNVEYENGNYLETPNARLHIKAISTLSTNLQ